MVNSLLTHAEPLPDRDIAMCEVTDFCMNVVLEAVWKHLRFEEESQLWELLSVVFEHFLICLERIEIDKFPSTKDKLSPGQIVLHAILGRRTSIH